MFTCANVTCISDVTNFINNPIKYCLKVKQDLVFNFERKLKVVDDFVQNFSCGPPPNWYQNAQLW